MKHKFGWDLPPGVTNRIIEEQAGAFEEEEMAQEMEKLVEEIAYFLSKHRFVSYDVRVVEADRDYAREIIRLILSAVRDGLELPGEVGRAEIGGAYMYPEPKEYKTDMITMRPVSWWHRTLEKVVNLENGDILIALRKEEKK